MPWISKIATGRQVLAGFVILLMGGGLLFGIGPFPSLQGLAPGGQLPEQQLGYDADELRQFLNAIGTDGRSTYLLFQGLDVLTPLLFGWPAMLGIAWLLKRGGIATGLTAGLPLVPVLFLIAEWSENFVLSNAVRAYPTSPPVSVVLPVLTGGKFFSLCLTFAVTVWCGLRLFWRKD
jgi:hypothetical protein